VEVELENGDLRLGSITAVLESNTYDIRCDDGEELSSVPGGSIHLCNKQCDPLDSSADNEA
jgi:translation initiation factor IF-1